jgi:hypothetical protein
VENVCLTPPISRSAIRLLTNDHSMRLEWFNLAEEGKLDKLRKVLDFVLHFLGPLELTPTPTKPTGRQLRAISIHPRQGMLAHPCRCKTCALDALPCFKMHSVHPYSNMLGQRPSQAFNPLIRSYSARFSAAAMIVCADVKMIDRVRRIGSD